LRVIFRTHSEKKFKKSQGPSPIGKKARFWRNRRVPSAFFPQALTFEAANAVVLAGLAKAAYGEFDEAKAAAAGYGLTAFEWIDLTQQFEDVYGFVAGGPDYVVIAFRGTDPKNWKNWMTDLQATAARFDWLFQGAAEVGSARWFWSCFSMHGPKSSRR
jgi:hypothetical protein